MASEIHSELEAALTTSRALAWSLGWPAGQVPADYVLGGVRAVLPSAVVDDARVVVRDGLVAEVGLAPAGAAADLDGRGLLCVPGLIDVHSDALEKERAPRPGVHLPWDFAVTSLEGTMSAAGITTAFHGAGFQDLRSATPGWLCALGATRPVEASLCATRTYQFWPCVPRGQIRCGLACHGDRSVLALWPRGQIRCGLVRRGDRVVVPGDLCGGPRPAPCALLLAEAALPEAAGTFT